MKTISIIAVLLVATGMIFSCKKQSAPSSVLSYTNSMEGVRTWSGTLYAYPSVSAVSPDTTFSFSGNTMAITVVNDTTIVFNSDTLKYFASGYKDTIAFAVRYYDGVSAIFLADTMWYNYVRNTIGYHYRFATLYNPAFEAYEYIDEHTQ